MNDPYQALGRLKTLRWLRKLILTLRPFNSSMIRTGIARRVPILKV
jgi:hypothetical protein